MTRTRRVATGIRSPEALVQLLREGGFPAVERHAAPVPLVGWNGKPTGEEAEIVLRRASLGATADDLGFARGADGTYEAVLSDIHAFRFDRRWFADLVTRHGRLAETGAEAQAVDSARADAGAGAQAASPERELVTEMRVSPVPEESSEVVTGAPQRAFTRAVDPLGATLRSQPAFQPPPLPDHADSSEARVGSDERTRAAAELEGILMRAERDLARPLGPAAYVLGAVWLSISIALAMVRNGWVGVIFFTFLVALVAVVVAVARSAKVAERAAHEFCRKFPRHTDRDALALELLAQYPRTRRAKLARVVYAIMAAAKRDGGVRLR